MVLVAPGICRFTVNATMAGRNVANILDMQIDTTGTPGDRPDAIDAVAGDILNNWSDHIIISLVDDYVAQSVSWLDLDEANGPTGSRSTTSETTWPEAGPSVSAPLPSNVSVLVKKQIVGARGRRNGRMYLTGFSEGLTPEGDGNTVDPATRAALDTRLASFLSGINDAEGPFIAVQRQLVVVHTSVATDGSGNPVPGADPVYEGYSPVQTLTCDTRLATQRRRLR